MIECDFKRFKEGREEKKISNETKILFSSFLLILVALKSPLI